MESRRRVKLRKSRHRMGKKRKMTLTTMRLLKLRSRS